MIIKLPFRIRHKDTGILYPEASLPIGAFNGIAVYKGNSYPLTLFEATFISQGTFEVSFSAIDELDGHVWFYLRSVSDIWVSEPVPFQTRPISLLDPIYAMFLLIRGVPVFYSFSPNEITAIVNADNINLQKQAVQVSSISPFALYLVKFDFLDDLFLDFKGDSTVILQLLPFSDFSSIFSLRLDNTQKRITLHLSPSLSTTFRLTREAENRVFLRGQTNLQGEAILNVPIGTYQLVLTDTSRIFRKPIQVFSVSSDNQVVLLDGTYVSIIDIPEFPICRITGFLALPNDKALSDRRILFRVFSMEAGNIGVPRAFLSAFTDSSGFISVNLPRGAKVQMVIEGVRNIFDFTVPQQDTANLTDLIVMEEAVPEVLIRSYPEAGRYSL